jgi:hypothetical protein
MPPPMPPRKGVGFRREESCERGDWTTWIGGHGRAEPIEGQSEPEALSAAKLSALFLGSGSRVTLACCKVGLDRPLIPTAFVANLLRSPRVARPTVRPTGGLQVRRRRSGTGRPAVAEDGRVRRPLPEPAFEVPGSGRAWLGGPTDARENLKKLRRQLGLRNN